ncbi:hypothetical protein D4L85_31895 [Chryseolinea soli]|uniref:Uncharacterized protein n=1 Tax=Chryseolinea soli TaxID=2321403 RepID=A0A385SSV0_9BACT|nr:hypothetical protein D4L85_31895 [Chryseolinea soli]
MKLNLIGSPFLLSDRASPGMKPSDELQKFSVYFEGSQVFPRTKRPGEHYPGLFSLKQQL